MSEELVRVTLPSRWAMATAARLWDGVMSAQIAPSGDPASRLVPRISFMEIVGHELDRIRAELRAPKRKAPPEADPDTPAARAFVFEFYADVGKAIGKAPPPSMVGRDIRLIRPLVRHYGADTLRKMGAEYFRYREAKGFALSIPGFVKQAEACFHYSVKREEGVTR